MQFGTVCSKRSHNKDAYFNPTEIYFNLQISVLADVCLRKQVNLLKKNIMSFSFLLVSVWTVNTSIWKCLVCSDCKSLVL